ncbi:hypothetical protein [Streptomyces sp. DH37]|uniref:hypothetical protein n=1 Tax=Streptomyces sp. DH37 TaxID=3040122 RepID=UPI0024432E07|nr:hypothetical protein [Streptomyces sp. DH37]MDG9705882.1 hypothetical protein [Streptomyces sp. DH37]
MRRRIEEYAPGSTGTVIAVRGIPGVDVGAGAMGPRRCIARPAARRSPLRHAAARGLPVLGRPLAGLARGLRTPRGLSPRKFPKKETI